MTPAINCSAVIPSCLPRPRSSLAAIEARLARLPDRLPAIEENAILYPAQSRLRHRGPDRVCTEHFRPGQGLLLKVTEDRATIVRDPDFDWLAANTAAGALICADPSLALTETGNSAPGMLPCLRRVGRWTWERDRKCNLVGKENVPAQGLAPRKDRLAGYPKRRSGEIAAAKGDPKNVSAGRSRPGSPTPTPSIPAPRASTLPSPLATISSASTAPTRSTARSRIKRRRSPARSRWPCWRHSPPAARSPRPARAPAGTPAPAAATGRRQQGARLSSLQRHLPPAIQRNLCVRESCRRLALPRRRAGAGELGHRGRRVGRLLTLPCGHPSRRPPLAGPQDEDRVCGRSFDEHRCRLASS